MGNALPTVTIVLAEIIAILVIALGTTLYLGIRKTRRHRAEISAVMDIARHSEKSLSSATPTDISDDFSSRTTRSIADIQEALARLDIKLGQIHREDLRHDEEVDHRIEEGNAQILAVSKDLRALGESLLTLGQEHTELARDVKNLRNEMDQHARHDVHSGTKSNPEPERQESSVPVDDFTLPDVVLAELEQMTKLAASSSDMQATAGQPATAGNTRSTAGKKSSSSPKAPNRQKIPRRTQTVSQPREAAVMLKTGTVDEPQYAFDPHQADDSFNVPYFIPGAVNAGIDVEELHFEDLNPAEGAGAHTGMPEDQPQFDAERVFYQASPHTGIKAGWYFTLRGGKVHGPFGSKETGERVLNEMIEHFKRTGDSGGR